MPIQVLEYATIRTGRGAHGITVGADGHLVFVTNIVDATVSAIDTGTRHVVATYSVGAGPNGVTFKPAAADSAEHDAHHPAQDQAAPAPGTGMPGADSLNGMPGMPGMMGVMTPEMMEIMHGMMAMRGDRARLSGMMMCPMMREMMGMASGAGPRTGEGGMDPRALYGMPAAVQEMTVESVRAWLEQRLAWHGNPRLKIGEIAAAGDATITAEIVTVDGSLVQKLAFNRYPGLVRQLAE